MLDSKNLYNMRVYAPNQKKCLGRIRAFVFYEKNCLGFLIKRPDILWMFHRKQAFLPLKEFSILSNKIIAKSKNFLKNNPKTYLKKQDIEWKQTVLWLDMPVKMGKKSLGYIQNFSFDGQNGKLDHIELSQGAISGVILGKNKIASKYIKGYSHKNGAVMLTDEVEITSTKPGVAEQAGKATSQVVYKLKRNTPKAVDKIQDQSDKIHKMFGDFKEELKKGMEE